jgi:hypothetical protein
LLAASEESACCGLHRGADRWNAPPGLASVVRLRACWSLSASVLGSRLLETAGRLEDPLDRPKNVELEYYTSFKGQVLQTFFYVCTDTRIDRMEINNSTHNSIFRSGLVMSYRRLLLG